jgi:four helix bundle protein
MTETVKYHYDLEKRTYNFSKDVRSFIRKIVKSQLFYDDCRHLVRSSGSVGANYIEANEALSKKDFLLRIKICRKEAKETRYWLELLELNGNELIGEKNKLVNEITELMKIFGSIITNAK